MPVINTVGSKVEVSLLDRKHEFYNFNIEAWKDVRLVYEGGNALYKNANRFLQPRPKEPNEVLQTRLSRLLNLDTVSTGIAWYKGKLFRQEPEIVVKTKAGADLDQESMDWFGGFTRDCNRSGLSLSEMMADLLLDALLCKSAWVLIDRPSAPQALTVRDQIDAGMRQPFLVRYLPEQVYNWAEDAAGNLKWVVFATSEISGDFLGKAESVDRWYYFDERQFVVYEYRSDIDASPEDKSKGRAQVVAAGNHALYGQNRVPVRRLTVKNDYWFGNRALLAMRAHLNAANALDWGLMMGCFAMPYIASDSDMKAVFSEINLLKLEKGDTAGWLEHPGGSFATMRDWIATLREEIYRSMYLMFQGRSSDAQPAVQSGYAKELEMDPANDAMQALGKLLTPFEQNVINDIFLARNLVPGASLEVSTDVRGYDFTPSITAEEVDVAQAVLDMKIPSDTLVKLLQKKIGLRAIQTANKEEKDTVTEEIDAAPTQSELDTQEAKVQQDLLAARYDMPRAA